MSEDQMDQILDKRDFGSFDKGWTDAAELVQIIDDYPNEEEIFIKLSEATNQHEICSYILDDFSLIYYAEQKSINTPFINYLKEQYQQGNVPQEWTD